jgi:4-amino-4-deoxy-L-arabinose transferase-like glycosyltransferase
MSGGTSRWHVAGAGAPSPRSRRLILVVLFVAGFLLRVAAAHFLLGGLNLPPHGDEHSYLRLAASLAEGRGFTDEDGAPHANRVPGLPWIISLLFRIIVPSVTGARLLMCALTSLAIPACYWLGLSAYDTRVGLITAAAAAVFPHWLYYGPAVLTDVPSAIAMTLVAAMLITGWRRADMGWLCAAGAAWGVAILIRPSNLCFAPVVILWILLVLPSGRRGLTGVAAVFLPLLLVVLPWCVRNSLAFGQPMGVSNEGGLALWIGNNPRATGILVTDYRYYAEEGKYLFREENFATSTDRAKAYRAAAIEFILSQPGRFLHLAFERFLQFWKIFSPRVSFAANVITATSFGSLLPFFFLRLLSHGWRRGPDLLLALLIASQTGLHTVFTSVVRYRIPVESMIIVLAVAGAVWVYDELRRRGGRAVPDST